MQDFWCFARRKKEMFSRKLVDFSFAHAYKLQAT